MKMSPVFLAVGLLAWVGCEQSSNNPPTNPTNQPAKPTNQSAAIGNPLTAPVDYLGAVAAAKKSSEKTIDTAYLNQAIQLFHTAEGRYPKDLNELAAEQYIGRVPDAPYGMKIVYDATRGEVRVVPQATNAATARR